MWSHNGWCGPYLRLQVAFQSSSLHLKRKVQMGHGFDGHGFEAILLSLTKKQDWSRWWSKSNLQVLVFCIITCNIPIRYKQFYFTITKEYHIHNPFQCAIQHTITTFFLGEIGSYLLVSFFFLLVVLVLMNQRLKYKFESFAKE